MTVYNRDQLFVRLKTAGEMEVAGGSAKEAASYFDTEAFEFDGPGGFKTDYAGLVEYFASIRAAFDDLTIERGDPIIEGNRIACQTRISGRFLNGFTMSPAGPIPSNGARVTFELNNNYDFDDRRTHRERDRAHGQS